ncbi:MAG TPA: alpha/beta hydrolase [Xanthobacteraceae bacterium]|nr:alpha/beta hydrolase [Xanthobacteraceae bacterium]
MPYATTRDNIRLYYEEVGSGTPLLFVHEFGGDHRSWEMQMRYFSRRYRCIAYSARGYTPSDVPNSPDAYSYKHFAGDVVEMLDHLKIAKAHIVGLSMGGYCALQVGLHHPGRALSLTLAGTGSGSELHRLEEFRKNNDATAKQFETLGSKVVATTYGLGPGRVPFEIKDPRGYAEFSTQFGEHDSQGSAHTIRGFQGSRPSIFEFESDVRKIALPTLIVVGDEDDACIESSLYLKRCIAASGLAMFPKTGHCVNLEEPALFNQTLADFLSLVEAGRWLPRDPRSVRK